MMIFRRLFRIVETAQQWRHAYNLERVSGFFDGLLAYWMEGGTLSLDSDSESESKLLLRQEGRVRYSRIEKIEGHDPDGRSRIVASHDCPIGLYGKLRLSLLGTI